MSKQPKTRKTATGFHYQTGETGTRNFYIPKGMLCVRVPGAATIDGKKVKNPWCLHQTPDEFLHNREFLEYGRTKGFVIGEEFLEPLPLTQKQWNRQLLDLARDEYAGKDAKGNKVPPEVVLQWIKDIACNYWEQYTPARALHIWNDVFNQESDNEAEFAAEYLEACDWDLYKLLDEKNVLRWFDFTGYWQGSLRYDYGFINHKGRKFFYRLDW